MNALNDPVYSRKVKSNSRNSFSDFAVSRSLKLQLSFFDYFLMFYFANLAIYLDPMSQTQASSTDLNEYCLK